MAQGDIQRQRATQCALASDVHTVDGREHGKTRLGVIYGSASKRPVPGDAPPVFLAVAADDGLRGQASIPIFEDWRAAGKSAELHVYAAGDHGFGMRRMGTTSDHWIEHFVQWMQASKLVPQ